MTYQRTSEDLTPLQRRLQILHTAKQRITDEITVLESVAKSAADSIADGQRLRRGELGECGTERRYQQHVHYSDTADEHRRVTCEPCLAAHAAHNRAAQYVREASKRLQAAT